jgi:hypothetical protein
MFVFLNCLIEMLHQGEPSSIDAYRFAMPMAHHSLPSVRSVARPNAATDGSVSESGCDASSASVFRR